MEWVVRYNEFGYFIIDTVAMKIKWGRESINFHLLRWWGAGRIFGTQKFLEEVVSSSQQEKAPMNLYGCDWKMEVYRIKERYTEKYFFLDCVSAIQKYNHNRCFRLVFTAPVTVSMGYSFSPSLPCSFYHLVVGRKRLPLRSNWERKVNEAGRGGRRYHILLWASIAIILHTKGLIN